MYGKDTPNPYAYIYVAKGVLRKFLSTFPDEVSRFISMEKA